MAYECAPTGYGRANTQIHQVLSIHKAEASPSQNDDLWKVIKEIKDGATFNSNYKQSQM